MLNTSSLYSPDQLSKLDRNRIPQHIAFIPDGNRRWAKANKMSIFEGHQKGADVISNIVKAAKELGVKVFTIYLFSTENWNRNPIEVQALMWLLEKYIKAQLPVMLEDGIQMQTIGDLSRFSPRIQELIQKTKEETAIGNEMQMVWALNYGARDEMRRAVQSICQDFKNKNFTIQEVTESLISNYLDTAQWNDPEILIRTSGEQRLSNFLLWQTSYSEIYTTPVLWPDFNEKHLLEAIIEYQRRERRLGGP